MTATIQPGWLPKDKAAERLKTGVRQLENRAAQGNIRKQTLPREPNERTARVLYSIEDIDAILAGRPNRYGSAVLPPDAIGARGLTVPETRAALEARRADPFAGLAAHLAQLARAFPPPKVSKPWMTLAEAAEWSGLPAGWLHAQAIAGAAFAMNTGRPGGLHRWRFNRAALREVNGITGDC